MFSNFWITLSKNDNSGCAKFGFETTENRESLNIMFNNNSWATGSTDINEQENLSDQWLLI